MKSKLMLSIAFTLTFVFSAQPAFAMNCEFTFTANGKTYYAIHNTAEGYYQCLNPEDEDNNSSSFSFTNPSDEYVAYDKAFYAAKVQHTCATELDASDYFTPMYISEEDVMAVSRGGTIVVSMDYGMLKEAYYGDPFFTADPEVYTGEEAVQLAKSMLPEAEYQKFSEEYTRTGKAEATAYVLFSVGNQGGTSGKSDLFMDIRLIGTKWISITRPVESAGKTWDTFSNVNRIVLRAKDGKLEVEVTGWGGPDLSLTPMQLKGVQPDIQVNQGNLRVEVFSLRNHLNEPVYIAVIQDKNGAEKSVWDISFQIGDTQRDSLNGYVDGKDAVYCCILNDHETRLLEEGTSIRLLHA